MSVWLTILLQFLPLILEFLQKFLEKGKPLGAADQRKLNNALWYMDQIGRAAVQAGCAKGGIKP